MEGGSALADGREEGGSPREAYLHMLLGKVQASGTRTDAGSWAAALCPTQGGGKEGRAPRRDEGRRAWFRPPSSLSAGADWKPRKSILRIQNSCSPL